MASGLALIQEELKREILKPYDESDPILQCGTAPLSIIQSRPGDVLRLAHEQLHSFPYKDVPGYWRRLYTEAALWKAVNLNPEDDPETKFVETLDMAVILTGAPFRQSLIHEGLSIMGQNYGLGLNQNDASSHGNGRHHMSGDIERMKSLSSREANLMSKKAVQSEGDILQHRMKRQKLSHRSHHNSDIPTSFPRLSLRHIHLDHPIPRKHNMTLTSFQAQLNADHQRNNRQGALPLIITEVIPHWPALSDPETSWNNPRYWLKTTLDGRRLVPIEIGRAYTDDDWSQKIIPFRDFMREYLLPQSTTSQPEKVKTPTGYLAQHDLFTQIPSLRADITIPDFCYSSPPSPLSAEEGEEEEDEAADEPTINIWLGPASTTSPLHTDPHHNILAQVFGHKYIRLYAPSQTGKLYPRSREGDVDLSNTSRVDVGFGMEEEGEGMEDRRKMREELEEEFPLFKDAEYVEGILGPGECLYIPRGWWHYVRSLSPSCSVSFWWD
jgi:hypothetical protein